MDRGLLPLWSGEKNGAGQVTRLFEFDGGGGKEVGQVGDQGREVGG